MVQNQLHLHRLPYDHIAGVILKIFPKIITKFVTHDNIDFGVDFQRTIKRITRVAALDLSRADAYGG